VIVENVGGAGGMTGSARVAKAVPYGYQLVFGGASTHAQVQSLYKKPLYDAAIDFTPVALVAEQPLVMIARKDLPAANLAAFIAHAKSNHAKMQYGSPGAGTGSHLACALLNAAIGVDITHVPYRGAGPAMNDLLGGRIDYLCPTVSTALSQIEGKLVQATAVFSRYRSPSLPNVASAHEQGIKDFEATSWNAIFLPKHVPAPILHKLHDAAVKAMDTLSLQDRLKQLGATVVPAERRSPDYLQAFVASEIAKWAGTIKASGVSMD
jgi:tripartite-type tricarboxylate transporter receptor subunit TctC